ncbi:MAG: response regulator transcription factor [Coleofasciculaceae cyanobacterium SM2_3_26]|nr:response regulator transcription factor [Coleofasciculaceae cyanobacterium SM2_3_26]
MMLQELLQRVAHQVKASVPQKILRHAEGNVEEVVLEFDSDGMHYYLVRSRPQSQESKESISLSPREQAIARLVAQGLPNKCIGKQLGISHWTVATYLRRMFHKLGVNSKAAAIAKLSQEHLL